MNGGSDCYQSFYHFQECWSVQFQFVVWWNFKMIVNSIKLLLNMIYMVTSYWAQCHCPCSIVHLPFAFCEPRIRLMNYFQADDHGDYRTIGITFKWKELWLLFLRFSDSGCTIVPRDHLHLLHYHLSWLLSVTEEAKWWILTHNLIVSNIFTVDLLAWCIFSRRNLQLRQDRSEHLRGKKSFSRIQ